MDIVDQAQARQEEELARHIAAARGKAGRGAASARECEDCGNPIPDARRRAAPGCRTCIECARVAEARRSRRAGP